MVKVFIVHGFEGKPNGGWRPWLMRELEKRDIYCAALVMKSPDTPELFEWIKEIQYNIKKFPNDEIILVGHSLGVPAILHFLQRKNPKNVKGCVLVSGPYKDDRKGKVANALSSFFVDEHNWQKIFRLGKEFVVIHGSDDKAVHFSHAEFLVSKLGGTLVRVHQGGHLNGSAGFYKLPQALKAIISIISK